MADYVTVTFEPAGVKATVPVGTNLLEAGQQAGVEISGSCGGQGTCGKCQVLVTEGMVSEPALQEVELLGDPLIERDTRLACQTELLGDAVVHLTAVEPAVVRKALPAESVRSVPLAPNVRRYDVQVPGPSLDDQRSDFRRLAEAVTEQPSSLTGTVGCLRSLASALRAEDQEVAVTVVGSQVVDVRPASQRSPALGIAVDIGTSTVAVYLVDLETGEHLVTAAGQNPQTQFGADVVSRIQYANSHTDGLTVLRDDVLTVINQLIRQAVEEAGAALADVYEATIVGNTCMHHIFLGLEPRYLAESPYVPVTAEAVSTSAERLGLQMNPRGNVFCLPCIAGFVGADTVGVIVASELTRRDRPTLAVDIGTNGEIALWSGERLLTTSCAAGPAFEGAQIHHGMRAAPGAIDEVFVSDSDLAVHTIDDQPARGICGSGLVDATAVLLALGLIDTKGHIVDGQSCGTLSDTVAERVEGEANKRHVVLADAEQSANSPIVLTQRDVREIQLAKSAIRASTEMLLEIVGLKPDDLDEVLIAGAFGNFINPASALRMGLLPEVPEGKIAGIGNAAGAGAILTLVSQRERDYARQVTETAEHIELFRSSDFQDRFAEYMIFP